MKTAFAVVVGIGLGFVILYRTAGEEEPDWEFRPDYNREVMWRLPSGGLITSGHLSLTGAFVPDPFSGDMNIVINLGPAGPGPAANDPQTKPWDRPEHQTEEVYEFRSGALVLGTLQYPGTFVPTVDEPVIWIDQWKPKRKNGKPSPRIYNLPGKMVPVLPNRRPKRYAGVPKYEDNSDWERDGKVRPPVEYKWWYYEDVERRVGLLRDNRIFIGRLNADGDFIPDPNIKPVAYTNEATVTIALPGGMKETVPVINHLGDGNEFVYEWRGSNGGNLVIGRLAANGSFYPTPGFRVVSWAWYATEAPDDGRRIYNLPGRLVAIAPPPRSVPKQKK